MNTLTQGLDTNKKIRIYDDTGSGDTFEVTNILYEDNHIIIGEASDEEMRTDSTSTWYLKNFKVMINRFTRKVVSFDFNFYLAENY
jgi:hypothetical protein